LFILEKDRGLKFALIYLFLIDKKVKY